MCNMVQESNIMVFLDGFLKEFLFITTWGLMFVVLAIILVDFVL